MNPGSFSKLLQQRYTRWLDLFPYIYQQENQHAALCSLYQLNEDGYKRSSKEQTNIELAR